MDFTASLTAPVFAVAGGAPRCTALLIAASVHASNGLPHTDAPLRWGTRLSLPGSSHGVLALSGGLLAAGARRHDHRLKRTGLASANALGRSLVVAYGLGFLAAHERPGIGFRRGHFWSGCDKALQGEDGFPSGHAMGSGAVASVIAREYSDRRHVLWLAYGFASMVRAPRVTAQRNVASDVVVLSVAGDLIGRLVQRRLEPAPTHGWLHPALQPTVRQALLALIRGSSLR